jgi:hypothetical protein
MNTSGVEPNRRIDVDEFNNTLALIGVIDSKEDEQILNENLGTKEGDIDYDKFYNQLMRA